MTEIESEFLDASTEIDGMTADALTLIDHNERRVACLGSVSEFMTAREINPRGNLIEVRSAHVVLFRASNAALAAILAAETLPAVKNGWQMEFRGKVYRIANASSDELAFEFDLQHPIT